MSHIDYTALVTPSDSIRLASLSRAADIKADCTDRISYVLDTYTLSNLRSAQDLGELTAQQIATFRAGQQWITTMRAVCRAAIINDTVSAWPPLPEGLVALCGHY